MDHNERMEFSRLCGSGRWREAAEFAEAQLARARDPDRRQEWSKLMRWAWDEALDPVELPSKSKPVVRMVGQDGNCFAILGRCKTAAVEAGWSTERWMEFREEATSGNYDDFLSAVLEHFDVDRKEEE